MADAENTASSNTVPNEQSRKLYKEFLQADTEAESALAESQSAIDAAEIPIQAFEAEKACGAALLALMGAQDSKAAAERELEIARKLRGANPYAGLLDPAPSGMYEDALEEARAMLEEAKELHRQAGETKNEAQAVMADAKNSTNSDTVPNEESRKLYKEFLQADMQAESALSESQSAIDAAEIPIQASEAEKARTAALLALMGAQDSKAAAERDLESARNLKGANPYPELFEAMPSGMDEDALEEARAMLEEAKELHGQAGETKKRGSSCDG